MRNYILTDHERTLIKRYLQTGEKLEGFKVLLHRIRKTPIQPEVVAEDLKLLQELLKKQAKNKPKQQIVSPKNKLTKNRQY